MNLLQNSIKFTQEGEIKIRVILQQKEGKDIVSLIVEDTGIGIPDETKKDIQSQGSIHKNDNYSYGYQQGMHSLISLLSLSRLLSPLACPRSLFSCLQAPVSPLLSLALRSARCASLTAIFFLRFRAMSGIGIGLRITKKISEQLGPPNNFRIISKNNEGTIVYIELYRQMETLNREGHNITEDYKMELINHQNSFSVHKPNSIQLPNDNQKKSSTPSYLLNQHQNNNQVMQSPAPKLKLSTQLQQDQLQVQPA